MSTSIIRNKTLVLLPLLSILALSSCSKDAAPLSLKERLHNAYLDSIEVSEEKIRPLVNINYEEKLLTWNETNDRVLLFTLHKYPTSYPDGETITCNWESWLCSVKELSQWYKNNKDNIKDPLLRVKQVLGMSDESPNAYISSLWISPSDLIRPAYITNVTSPMKTTFADDVSDTYKNWFAGQYYYSYETKKLPWTRLGYTYDWSEEAKDRYGLSEFVTFSGNTAIVDKTLPVEDFLATL